MHLPQHEGVQSSRCAHVRGRQDSPGVLSFNHRGAVASAGEASVLWPQIARSHALKLRWTFGNHGMAALYLGVQEHS